MIEVPLRIRYGPTPLRPTVAWLLPGDRPGEWLAELLRWSKAAALRLHVVPVSRQDRRPRGLLVTEGGPEAGASSPALPYGRLAERFYLPVEARLEPDVTETELAGLLAPERVYVMHPASGLCGFGPDEVLTLADLLERPEARPASWDQAQAGVTFPTRLTALSPDETPTFEDVLRQGRDDIGSSDRLDRLPPVEGEPMSGLLGKLKRMGRSLLSAILDGLTFMAPPDLPGMVPAHRPGFELVRWMRGYANRLLARNRDDLQWERLREVMRLMGLLQRDPDAGLRFALPLTGTGLHRGLAPPGSRLVARDPHFNLGRLGGGGSADFWDLPEEIRRKLHARYRELADRELQIGRYRRAAYIYAELLGDLEAAARALVAGRHWREAAVLYRERLRRPLEAAKCLEEGGLWTEAIVLYQELHEYEKAGDLHRKLEQEEEACRSYMMMVVQFLSKGDLLSAVGLLFDKLDDIDGGFATLEDGWPHSQQAVGCLRESFRRMGLLGRHVEARERVERFRGESLREADVAPLVEVLAEVASSYPDRGVQQKSADEARVWTATRLGGAGPGEARRLLTAVERLVPEDRLLPRDCQRFLQQRESRPVRTLSKRIRLVRTIRLPAEVYPKTAVRIEDVFYVAGWCVMQSTAPRCGWEHLALMRYRADGTMQQAMIVGVGGGAAPIWTSASAVLLPALKVAWGRDTPILLGAAPHGDHFPVIHLAGQKGLEQQIWFPGGDTFVSEVRFAGRPGMSGATVGLARPATHTTWLLEWIDDHTILKALDSSASILTTRFLETVSIAPPCLPVPMHAWADTVAVALSKFLFLARLGTTDVVHLSHDAVSMSGSLPHTRRRLAIGFPVGGMVYWDDAADQERFGMELTEPVTAFLDDGRLVAAAVEGIEVYETHDKTLRKVSELPGPHSRPLAVLPHPLEGQFAVLFAGGVLELFAV